MTVASVAGWVGILLFASGISFWGSFVFTASTRPRLHEGWGWLEWRGIPHDMGTVMLRGLSLSIAFQLLLQFSGSWIESMPSGLQMVLTLLVYHGVIVVWIYRHLKQCGITEHQAIGFESGDMRMGIVWGFVGFCMALPLVFMTGFLSQFILETAGIEFTLQPLVDQVSRERSLMDSLLLVALVGFVGPFLEEIIFRGVLLVVLVRHLGPWGGLCVHAVLFALIHLHVSSMLPLFALAVLLGLVYIYTRNIMACVWVHVFFNCLTLLQTLPVFGLEAAQ